MYVTKAEREGRIPSIVQTLCGFAAYDKGIYICIRCRSVIGTPTTCDLSLDGDESFMALTFLTLVKKANKDGINQPR